MDLKGESEEAVDWEQPDLAVNRVSVVRLDEL